MVQRYNLLRKFDIEEERTKKEEKFIIINTRDRQAGFIVDNASQVVRIRDDQIGKLSNLLYSRDIKYIEGIGKIDDKIIKIYKDIEI